MLSAYDMGADSPTRLIDGADRIGLGAADRHLLIERGVLLLDSGKGGPARASAAELVRRLPASALAGVEAIFFGDARPGSATIIVKALVNPSLLIEIEAVAAARAR